jgi:hypothetical protein
MGKAFVNFRVGDGDQAAVLIDHKLCAVFGSDNVFRSGRSIPAGISFPPELEREAANCAVMLVVVGGQWLVRDGNNRRRIDAPADWVRTEIEHALGGGRPVIPVLVGGRGRLGVDDDLPPSIAELVERNYLRLGQRSAEADLARVADAVRPHLERQDGSLKLPRPKARTLLTSLRPTSRSQDIRLTAAQINGRYYADSVVFRCDLFASHPIGTVSFNLGKQYRRFEATVGVLDNAAEPNQVGVFQVVTDGMVRAKTATEQGDPRVVTVDVTDVLSLRLEAHRPGTNPNPLLAGVNMTAGISNNLPELAWGNPTLYS